MTEQSIISSRVAYLATGDEICHGDILNSNGQEIALRLFSHGIPLGMHMAVADHLDQMTAAIHFLLKHHHVLIITGGLGPTSDDLTREALSRVLNQALMFDEPTWQAIRERLKKFGYETPPKSNRQQAFFPEGSTIIPNPNGTAAGCLVETETHCIFMLPGPPIECLPMVDHAVLPFLLKHPRSDTLYCKKWLCFGVSEAQIAEEIDVLATPFRCNTGYRYCYPYTEVKIYSQHKTDINLLSAQINKAVSAHIILDGTLTASTALKNTLSTLKTPIVFCDHATGGLLEATLKTPDTSPYVRFVSKEESDPSILTVTVSGLNEFWNRTSASHTTIEIVFRRNHVEQKQSQTIPLRGERVKMYAVEWVARLLHQQIILSSQ